MEAQFVITGLNPISTNLSHKIAINKRTRKRFNKKTDKYVIFQKLFHTKMTQYNESIMKMNRFFNDEIHCLHIDYKFYYPVNTKKGVISKTSKDVDNLIKTTQDTLFGCFLFDDAYITKVSSEKIHSETLKIEITVKILDYLKDSD